MIKTRTNKTRTAKRLRPRTREERHRVRRCRRWIVFVVALILLRTMLGSCSASHRESFSGSAESIEASELDEDSSISPGSFIPVALKMSCRSTEPLLESLMPEEESIADTTLSLEEQVATLVTENTGTLLTYGLLEQELSSTTQGQVILNKLNELLSYTNGDVRLVSVLAQIVTAEIGGLSDAASYSSANMEKAAVVWCILNRAVVREGDDVYYVATYPNAFAYNPYGNVFVGCEEIVEDVLCRWVMEYYIASDVYVGRVLPEEYTFFSGDGKHNHFRASFDYNSTRWDWSYKDPYI